MNLQIDLCTNDTSLFYMGNGTTSVDIKFPIFSNPSAIQSHRVSIQTLKDLHQVIGAFLAANEVAE